MLRLTVITLSRGVATVRTDGDGTFYPLGDHQTRAQGFFDLSWVPPRAVFLARPVIRTGTVGVVVYPFQSATDHSSPEDCSLGVSPQLTSCSPHTDLLGLDGWVSVGSWHSALDGLYPADRCLLGTWGLVPLTRKGRTLRSTTRRSMGLNGKPEGPKPTGKETRDAGP